MPASIYATWWSLSQLDGRPAEAVDEHWRAEHGAEIVYFHGFDNVYHWALMDLVFLMAHGDRYVTPESNVCNEFYDLDGEKFSTSRGHLIWTADLLAGAPRDLVRCYLALTAPEYQRSNFTTDAMRTVLTRRLIGPWNRLADALSLTLVAVDTSTALPTTEAGRGRAAAMARRLRPCYELPGFSMTRAAETILNQLDRLLAMAEATGGHPGDLLLEVRTLLSWAAPILIDTAEQAAAAGVDLNLAGPSDPVAAFELPRLPRVDAGAAALAGNRRTTGAAR
jgi:methionyl-tRNA synthetase